MKGKIAALLIFAMALSGPAGSMTHVMAAEDSIELTEEVPDEEIPDEEISDEEISDEKNSDEEISDEEIPDENISDEIISDEEISVLDEDQQIMLEDDKILTSGVESEEADVAEFTDENDTPAQLNGMNIQDGMAQPMASYSSIEDGYTNNGSDILRFAVYVETDYDTDQDGKRDLVQAVVQVPRAAAEQKYDAPTIFEASPYFAGTDSTTGLEKSDPTQRIPLPASAQELGGWTEEDLYTLYSGTARTYDIEKKISTSALASRDSEPEFSSKNWYYSYPDVPNSDYYYYYALSNHDYFLIRGFAIVESAGLGTNGSDGLETCGSIAEVSAFKNVVEWINHKEGRHAFADRAGTIPIEADWSNGRVAMRGCSYNGTMAYEVAATGVEGLETIVPEAAISSWYEYSNTQGVSHFDNNKYTSYLASGTSSRFFGLDPLEKEDPDAWNKLRQLCSRLFGYFDHAQEELAGHFGHYWESREYSYADNIKIPALIVTGFNDYNVTIKQADLMRKAFERSGQDVRMILHQGTHETLETIMIDDMYYEEILNKWYCHYLLDVDNGMPKDLPAIYVQSNTSGNFEKYDKLYGDETLTIDFANTDEITLIHTSNNEENESDQEESTNQPDPENPNDYCDFMISGDDPYFTMEDYISSLTGDAAQEAENGSRYWESLTKRVPQELTIQGKTTVSVRAKVPSLPEGSGRMLLGAFLYDISDTPFPAYDIQSDVVERSVYIKDGIYIGEGLANSDIEFFKQTPVKQKLITKGMIDLGSPAAGYEPRTAVQGSVSADTYYDYTIHMLPTVYTVQPGHYLWLYLVPAMDGIYSDVDVILDNPAGSVNIPVKEIPEGFEKNNDFSEECTDDTQGKKIVETVDGKEVAVKIVDTSNNIVTVSSNIWMKNLYPEYAYLGVPVTPFFELYDGTVLLSQGKDYKVSYENNKKPTEVSGKDSKLTITFIGNYSKTEPITQTYKISKTILSENAKESEVTATDITAAYTGKSLQPVPELSYNCEYGSKINKNNFRFSYLKDGAADPVSTINEAGEYTVIIEPKDANSTFYGKMYSHLTVIGDKNLLLQNAKVTFSPKVYTFTGKAITPKPGTYSLELKLDGKKYTKLTEDTDYCVSLVKNNTYPGKAEVIFTAAEGNEKGLAGSVSATFTIKNGKDLKDLAANEIYFENYVQYSKSGAAPSWVILYDNGQLLENGKDYTITCKNNKRLSTDSKPAKLIIKGKGRYKGTISRDFCVVQAFIRNMNVYVKDKAIPVKSSYKGHEYEKPTITVTDSKGNKLKAGTDFSILSYSRMDESGNAVTDAQPGDPGIINMSIEGKGNYFGVTSVMYNYYDKKYDLGKTTVLKSISSKTYNGAPVELTNDDLYELLATGTKNAPGERLAPDANFVVEEYRNNNRAGTATVVLRGKGKFGGTKTLKFTIKPQEPKKYLGVLK